MYYANKNRQSGYLLDVVTGVLLGRGALGSFLA